MKFPERVTDLCKVTQQEVSEMEFDARSGFSLLPSWRVWAGGKVGCGCHKRDAHWIFE